ncbi:hypothetical protein BWI15_15080 [Kribbella sp. ALI-6-A]|uniref:hypothetical protein n=1 Tax=Kribbella sp. ALI-6-A TaxID=1933817 RepID=UPI00097C8967|nr:hypothetical protein [Kribbella sp. ALI-6-A]ONI71501.1 hypothetical protein BWI15_15080 [Kribbella sp. ALI-6-A]
MGTDCQLGPSPPTDFRFSDEQFVASSVDLDGRLIALIADAVTPAAVDRPYRARAVVVGPSDVTIDVELEPLDAEYPMIDALGDGFVVADARNRWKSDGSLAWLPAYDGVGWMDCYALNVGEELTWGCLYHEFPLVTVDRKGVRGIRGTSVRGARGLLVSGPLVAFLGEYDDYRHDRRRTAPSRQVTVSIGWSDDGDDVLVERKVPLTMPDGSEPPGQPRQVVCRDDRAFVRFDDAREWFVVQL